MAKSKYQDVVQRLKPLPVEDQKYQDKVNAVKDQIRAEGTHTAESLAKLYTIFRADKERIEEELSETNKWLTAIEQMLVASHDTDEPGWGMYGAGDNTVRLPSGGSVSVQLEPIGKVVDKEAFRLWCIANGYENSLQLWPTTMNAITKNRLLEGDNEPDGVEAYFRAKVVFRKG